MARKNEKRTIQKKMWDLLTELRGQIDGWDFKNYSLTMIFYKFLSENFEDTINAREREENPDFKYSELKDEMLTEDFSNRLIDYLGYFIKPSELFCNIHKNASTNENLNKSIQTAFNNIQATTIGSKAEESIKGVFDDFDVNSTKLGKEVKDKNDTLRKLINCVATLNFETKHTGLVSDTFGDMYEYLMGMYAKNAGKSGGEYFTPPEVSMLLARLTMIGKKEIKNIYDPTCGSGSLLLKAAKIVGLENIKKGFYGQEKNTTTYNLCRENMLLHNIDPNLMDIKNGDTLSNPMHRGEKFEIIVSNPPYSVKWETDVLTINDERFAPAGVLAPTTKADYAFLQHVIFHLASNGTAGIVLPHGVLFRNGTEGVIRKHFIENNYIDSIISLPSNLFYGTGIPTIIMIFKKERSNSDVLFVDASKCFEKDKNQNVLRDADIERIYDAVVKRKDIENFAKLVTKEEIRNNEYNLNIPRYITSDSDVVFNDLYSLMTGKFSNEEISSLDSYFNNFVGLKEKLFDVDDKYSNYYNFKNVEISDIVNNDEKVKEFKNKLKSFLNEYEIYLNDKLIKNMDKIDSSSYEELKWKLFDIFTREDLIEIYEVFQIISDNYQEIYSDISAIQKNGLSYCNKTEEKITKKIANKKTVEVKDGYVGTIIPLELVKENYLSEEFSEIDKLQEKANEQNSIYSEIFESLDEDLKLEVCKLTKDNEIDEENSGFDLKRLNSFLKKNDSEELKKAKDAIDSEKKLNKKVKDEMSKIDEKAKNKLELLSEDEIIFLLKKKWISPIIEDIETKLDKIIENFILELNNLKEKYSSQLSSINKEIKETENKLSEMLDDLTGNDTDLEAIKLLKELFE